MLTGWQIPVIVTGTLFLWMFNLDYGLVNYILQSLHFISEPIGWTVDASAALPAVIIANIWLGIPFNLIMMSAAIAGLPSDIYEAATVDGASGWQKIRHITIPLLRPAILAVLMLGFIYTLRVFDLIWIMTKGGPGNATEVLPTFAYRLAFVLFDFGRSAAVAVIVLLILLVAAVAYLRWAFSDERMRRRARIPTIDAVRRSRRSSRRSTCCRSSGWSRPRSSHRTRSSRSPRS